MKWLARAQRVDDSYYLEGGSSYNKDLFHMAKLFIHYL